MLKLRRTLPYSTKKRGKKAVLTQKMKRRIKAALSAEKPTVWIGKEGVTAQSISEIAKQLDAREMIKVKILKTALQEEEAKIIATQVAEQTESELVDVRGHTFLLFKRKKKR
jgi:RNA-binding protein